MITLEKVRSDHNHSTNGITMQLGSFEDTDPCSFACVSIWKVPSAPLLLHNVRNLSTPGMFNYKGAF